MTVELSNLPPAAVIETVSYEDIFTAMLDDLKERDSSLSITAADPAYKILEVAAYREALVRAELNDRAKGLLLAYATGSDLDHLGVTYFRTRRLLIQEGDKTSIPPVPDVWESDEDYRARLLIAEDGYSTAGPEEAYIYHAKSADPRVRDLTVVSPQGQPGTVYVTVLWAGLTTDPEKGFLVSYIDEETGKSITEHDDATDALTHLSVMKAVDDRLQEFRPLTDQVIVQPPGIVEYKVDADLILYPGVDETAARTLAESRLLEWIESQKLVGRDISVAGIKSALMVEGVHDVVMKRALTDGMASPNENLGIDDDQVAYCTAATVGVSDHRGG